ncbi:MAG: type II secretion system F family protein [Bacillota bacterium]|nr:type II secretion system F family protein [Bacillota bacterium]
MQLLLSFLFSAFTFCAAAAALSHAKRDALFMERRIKNLFSGRAPEKARLIKRRNAKTAGKLRPTFAGSLPDRLSVSLSVAGIKLRAEEFLYIWAACAILPIIVARLLNAQLPVCAALFAAGASLPLMFVERAKAKRLALFEQQLSDALIIIGNCLRTGLSFQQAVNSIARDMPEPVSKEFGRLSKEVELGVTLEKALENMVDRLKSKDFMLIAAAVLIQRQIGGNLSEILDGISDTIRERIKLKTSVKVLTASGRTSGMVIGLMPVIIFFLLMLLNPSYIMMFFKTRIGIMLLCVSGALETAGFLTVRKIVSIKY